MVSLQRWHPVAALCYFAAVIGLTMTLSNPLCQAVSLVSGMAAYGMLAGPRRLAGTLLFTLPMVLLAALVNPLFSQAGLTVLFYLNDSPVTLEALLSGLSAAAMLAGVLYWFACFSEVMTSDKLIFLFGRFAPAIALTISMALRLVPHFRRQAAVIRNAQKTLGGDVGSGSWLSRARGGVRMTSILVTWALENGVDTADSMRARGYSLRRKTSYSAFRFRLSDGLVLAGTALLLILAAALTRRMSYLPVYTGLNWCWREIVGCGAHLLLCAAPLIFGGMEVLWWRFSLSRI